MGFSSQAGSVAFRTQSVAATFPADLNTNGVIIKTKTGALATNRDLLIPDPEIGGGRDVNDAFLGAAFWSGDYEFYVRPGALGTLLKAAFGTQQDGPGGVNEKETITMTGSPTGGSFTLTYSGQTTAAIPYNATAAQVQDALVNLSNIGYGEVWCTGGPFPATAVVVNFTGTLSGTLTGAPMTKTDSLTGGSTPATAITRTVTGLSNVGTFSHLFVPNDLGAMPFIAFEENVGNGLDVYRYTDGVVNTFHLEAEANGYLMGTAGMIARLQTAQASPTAIANTDSLDMIVGTNITATFNSVTLAARSFKFDFDNGITTDDFRLGSLYLGDLTAKRRTVTAGVHVREQDKNLYRQAVYGSSAATAVGGVITKSPVVITASTYSTIPGSSPSLAYSLMIELPLCAIKPYPLKASGDDIIESDIEFQALRPFTNNPVCRVTLVNGSSVTA